VTKWAILGMKCMRHGCSFSFAWPTSRSSMPSPRLGKLSMAADTEGLAILLVAAGEDGWERETYRPEADPVLAEEVDLAREERLMPPELPPSSSCISLNMADTKERLLSPIQRRTGLSAATAPAFASASSAPWPPSQSGVESMLTRTKPWTRRKTW